MLAIASAWIPPISALPQSAYFVQLYVWMWTMFWKTSSGSPCFCLKPTTQVTFLLWQSADFFQLYVWMCIMFQKTYSESHCFCLKPTSQCTFTERILCSIVCLHVYSLLKNFLCEPLLLLESHQSVHFHRAHILFNCMFECEQCFEKLLLEAIVSAWSPPLKFLCYFDRAQTFFKFMFECE